MAAIAKSENKVISKNNIKRLLKDVAQIIKNPLTEQGIYYVHDEFNMYKGYAMIIGPDDTPYEGGYYFFEFNYTNDYPFSPPKVVYNTNDGTTRFNPNLYRNGKVCVSILNTWRGEQWTSCQNISSILLTLVTLLNDNPLTNEPGFKPTHKSCIPYNRIIEYKNYTMAILRFLNKDNIPYGFKGFHPIILKHFNENKTKILDKITQIIKSGDRDEIQDYVSVYNMRQKYNYAKLKKDFENA
jgi:ubiquitin-conjugating enzyme E2 Z